MNNKIFIALFMFCTPSLSLTAAHDLANTASSAASRVTHAIDRLLPLPPWYERIFSDSLYSQRAVGFFLIVSGGVGIAHNSRASSKILCLIPIVGGLALRALPKDIWSMCQDCDRKGN